MSLNYLEPGRDGKKERMKGDVIDWSVLSTRDPFVFEIKVEENVTIILVDTFTECVLIVHNPWHAHLFVKRFSDMPQLLGYLECCSDSGKYVLKDPENDCGAYVHRRDLIDVLVRCMAKMPHYAKPYYSKDEVDQPDRS